jgi:uncharacterized membrane protein YGL010W
MSYFELEKTYGFYGAFHYNQVNKAIHLICVPLIFTSSLELLSRVVPLWIIQSVVVFYCLSFLSMNVTAGILYAPIIGFMYFAGTSVLSTMPWVSTGIFVFAWTAQFIGHGIYEKRAPALLTNLPQSLHAAVFFVWIEIIFSLGFMRPLRLKLEKAVELERRSRGFKI